MFAWMGDSLCRGSEQVWMACKSNTSLPLQFSYLAGRLKINSQMISCLQNGEKMLEDLGGAHISRNMVHPSKAQHDKEKAYKVVNNHR